MPCLVDIPGKAALFWREMRRSGSGGDWEVRQEVYWEKRREWCIVWEKIFKKEKETKTLANKQTTKYTELEAQTEGRATPAPKKALSTTVSWWIKSQGASWLSHEHLQAKKAAPLSGEVLWPPDSFELPTLCSLIGRIVRCKCLWKEICSYQKGSCTGCSKGNSEEQRLKVNMLKNSKMR